MDFTVDVKGYKATVQRIERGITDGMEDAAESLLQSAEDDAKDVLRDTRRIWRREVYHGFVTDIDSDKTEVNARLANMAPHATVVERGATYTNEGPPVTALLPWVATHFGGTTTDSSGGDDGFGDDGGGGYTLDFEDDEDDTDDETDDIDAGNYPSGTYDGQTAVELAREFDEVDEGWRFSDVGEAIDRNERLLPTQRIIVATHDGRKKYVVGDYRREYIMAKPVGADDSELEKVRVDGSFSEPAVIAFEDVDEWSEQQLLDAVDRGIERISYQYSNPLEQIHVQEDVELGFDKLKILFNNKKHLAQMTAQLERVKDVGQTKLSKPHVSNTGTGMIKMALHGHTHKSYGSRPEHEGMATLFHEFSHVFHHSRDSDATKWYHNSNNDWDMTKRRRGGDWKLEWDYVDQGGPDAWDVEPNKTDPPLPHPNAYFLINKNPEQLGETNTPGEIANEGFYEPFDEWGEYVYNDVLKNSEKSFTEIDEDPVQFDIFHPKFGAIEPGHEIEFIKEKDDGSTMTFGLRAATPVEEVDFSEWDEADYDGMAPAVIFEDGNGDKQIPIRVNDDGTFWNDTLSTNKWLYEVEDSYDYDDSLDDPGLVSDDPYEQFLEGVNRTLLRAMIRSETKNTYQHSSDFINQWNYHGTNGHESSSGFGEMWWAASLDVNDGGPTDGEIVGMFENNPTAAFAAAKYFNVPDRVKNVMEKKWGMDWSEILREVDPGFSI